MTFIQPSKQIDIMNAVIAVLVCALFCGTFWLVIAYNKTVDLSHDIASDKAKLDTIGAENTALNNRILATLGGSDFSALASANGLVTDKNPQYFPINEEQWPLASQ